MDDKEGYKVASLDQLDYFWNDPQCKQIIGRAVRATSHITLPQVDIIPSTENYKTQEESG